MERAREQKALGANWPGSELARVLLANSLQGANWPGNLKAWYQLQQWFTLLWIDFHILLCHFCCNMLFFSQILS